MKTTDSVMREKFDKWFEENISQFMLRVHFAGDDVQATKENLPILKSVFEGYLSHSLAEARREEQERILTMAHNIRSELKEPGYISLTRLEDLLTGDNPEEAK